MLGTFRKGPSFGISFIMNLVCLLFLVVFLVFSFGDTKFSTMDDLALKTWKVRAWT